MILKEYNVASLDKLTDGVVGVVGTVGVVLLIISKGKEKLWVYDETSLVLSKPIKPDILTSILLLPILIAEK